MVVARASIREPLFAFVPSTLAAARHRGSSGLVHVCEAARIIVVKFLPGESRGAWLVNPSASSGEASGNGGEAVRRLLSVGRQSQKPMRQPSATSSAVQP